jgi:UDP-glucose:(heptosyl)LPS alpha-1,3-glucosyltransferase
LIRQRFTGFGGAELYVSRLARELIDRGHDVHILARRWPAGDASGVKFHRINSLGGPTFIRLRSFARSAARLVEAGGYELVHSFERTYSQDIFRAGDGCHKEWLERRKRMRGPVFGILDRINPRHRAFLDLEARLFSDARLKMVLANSRQGREEIIRHYGLPDAMIRVVYNGLDRNKFHAGLAKLYRIPVRRELGLTPDEPAALFVGSGYARKGLGELIRALPHCPVRLLVAGQDRPGPYQSLAGRVGVREKVSLLGPRTDVERLYGAADVFVLPSWYEPFSNACLEAMASGLPVITTRETGAAEIIREGVNGYTLSFPVSPQDLAEKTAQALDLDRSTLVEANRELLAPFTWEKNLADTLAAYEACL